MTTRAYIVPLIGDGAAPATAFRPDYVAGMIWAAVRLGLEPAFLVGAEGTDAQHAAVAAQVPVTVAPPDLGTIIATQAEADALAAELEAWGIPARVQPGMTWAAVLRGVAAQAVLVQRFGVPLLPSGLTFNATLGQFPQEYRDRFLAAVDSLGLARGSLDGSTTLRKWLQTMAGQWAGRLYVGTLVL